MAAAGAASAVGTGSVASGLAWPARQVDVQRTFVHFASPNVVGEQGKLRRSASWHNGGRPAICEQVLASGTSGTGGASFSLRAFEASVGSLPHLSGGCRPCAWRWRPGGCANGRHCRYCHLCEDGAVKLRKREKVLAARRAASAREAEPVPKMAYVGVPCAAPVGGAEPLAGLTLGVEALMSEAVRRAQTPTQCDASPCNIPFCTPSTSSGSDGEQRRRGHPWKAPANGRPRAPTFSR